MWKICSLIQSPLETEPQLRVLGHSKALLNTGAYKQEEKEASESGSTKEKEKQCACPLCVWLSLNENKSGAIWITS